MIEAQSLSKQYGPHYAVNKVSFTSTEGKIFGLLGPNGAGKSTVIKMLMNEIAPDSGKVLLNGKTIREQDRNRIGYLPEERILYRNVKINEMLLYLASLKNGNTAAAEKNLDAWLARFDLMGCKNKTTETLSNSMTQKVQFITAVLHDPDFIFLDEPFSGLDPSSIELLKEAICALAARGKNIILSTHNMEIADLLCTSVIIMDRGKIVLSGNLADLKSRLGKKTVSIEFDGFLDGDYLSKMARSISSYPTCTEIELADGFTTDVLLKKLMEHVTLRKFEVIPLTLRKLYGKLIADTEGNRELEFSGPPKNRLSFVEFKEA